MEIALFFYQPWCSFKLPKSNQGYVAEWITFPCPCRACYVAFKGDLKARYQVHEFRRNYQCNLTLVISYSNGVSSRDHCWISFATTFNCSLKNVSLGFNLVTRMCDRCLAETGDNCDPHMNFKNMSSTAAWPLTGLDQNQYELLDAFSQSLWSAMPGFNLENISFF